MKTNKLQQLMDGTRDALAKANASGYFQKLSRQYPVSLSSTLVNMTLILSTSMSGFSFWKIITLCLRRLQRKNGVACIFAVSMLSLSTR